MVYQLSTEDIIELLEVGFGERGAGKEYQQQRTAEMIVQYYDFLNTGSVFEDVNVRKAFCYAVDRKLILYKILEGEADAAGLNGVVPPVFSGYDAHQVKGYDLDVKKARQYLARAGYPNGKGFPEITLNLNLGGGRNLKVAIEVIRQLKENLNVEIKFKISIVRIVYFILVLLLSMFNVSAQIAKQDLEQLKLSADTLATLGDSIINGQSEYIRQTACYAFIPYLVRALKINRSFDYKFNSLKTVSMLYPPDSSFRIFCWQLRRENGTYRHYGAIQLNSEELKLYPFYDHSDFITNPTELVLSSEDRKSVV